MAIVDLSTGEVFGCEKYSKVWFHEQAHIKFNKTDWGIKINYYGYFFQMVAVFVIALSLVINYLPLKLFGLTNALGMVCCYIYEEVWCWVVGLKEFKCKKFA